MTRSRLRVPASGRRRAALWALQVPLALAPEAATVAQAQSARPAAGADVIARDTAALADVVEATARPGAPELPASTSATASAASAASAHTARALLDAGLPLAASRELARVLSLRREANPTLVLLAARAHAETLAWSAVQRLLLGRSWLDTLEDGAGRLLLAHAERELGRVAQALRSYERAIGPAGAAPASYEQAHTEAPVPAVAAPIAPPGARVGYARALALAGRRNEAMAQLLAAAEERPLVAHWLRLSALQQAAHVGDTAAARTLADALADEPAIPRDSVLAAVTAAHFRAGDIEGGLARFASLRAARYPSMAVSRAVPAHLARGDTASARSLLEQALGSPEVPAEAGSRLLALDSSVSALREVARSDVRAGRPGRAAAYLRRALAAAPDSLRAGIVRQLAEARFAAGAYEDVSRVLEPLLVGGPDAGPEGGLIADLDEDARAQVWFLHGRALYRLGLIEAAEDVWEDVAERVGTPPADYAAYMVADIRHDRGDLEGARRAYELAVARFPRNAFGAASLIRLACLAMLQGDYARGLESFETYRRRFPGGDWSQAATWWVGRAHEKLGETAAARRVYRETLDMDPLSIYGARSAAELGVDPWSALGLPVAAARDDGTGDGPAGDGPAGDGRAPDGIAAGGGISARHAALLARMRALRELGWPQRVVRELDAARRVRSDSPAVRLALAEALNAEGWSWEGVRIGWEVYSLRGGEWSERLLEVLYPLPYPEAVRRAATARGLDPAVVAALARRESLFDRDVVSSAGAVGLMQLLPRTAAGLAGRAAIAEFGPERLAVPEVNLALGTLYLRDLLDRFGGSRAEALAAYNAGPHRVVRWRKLPAFTAGNELLIERIPFSETRNYVKAILGAAPVYQRLYGLGRPVAGAGPRQ